MWTYCPGGSRNETCQDISVAGKQVGITGSRSGLWSEMHRIISELRPRFAVIENVPNLARLGLDRVLADLAAIGYDAEWQCISARDVGAPHLRKRIWIVAYPNRNRLEENTHDEILCQQTFNNGNSRYFGSMGSAGVWSGERPIGARPVGMDNGPTDEVDRLKGLGNAIIPQIAEIIGRRLLTQPSYGSNF